MVVQENLMWEAVSLLIATLFPRHSPTTLDANAKNPFSL